MDQSFTAVLWYWRGPAPFYFLTVPPRLCRELAAIAPAVTYGWGMIPAIVRVGDSEWTTSLFPKDGGYVIPVKADVRHAEQLEDGEDVTAQLIVDA
ncbi:MAG: DUF1905 domain-containing protein [Actinomycetota bacterium]|nr:DUF1905 domain-containing protein [Actinomycetota bacterium]